ncbi:MAG: hypothetical protein IPJ30_12665 [Acidobacteria bacterium]|nr:hypothetical protein [Acidobacteriota bacterium]
MCSGGITAQGVVIPMICEFRPCLRPMQRPMPVPLPNALPVKSIELDTRIEGQIATTPTSSRFQKRHALHARRNVLYTDTGIRLDIIRFAVIWENGKKLVGEVRS